MQVGHRATPQRWTDRAVLESDDLDALFLDHVAEPARRVPTGRVTCRWTRHPGQHSAPIQESRDGA